MSVPDDIVTDSLMQPSSSDPEWRVLVIQDTSNLK